MTSTQERPPMPDSVVSRAAPPHLRQVLARVAASVATAVLVPTALFAVTLLAVNLTVAVLVALGWMTGAMCWRRTVNRPVSGLLVLALAIMTLRTGLMLATGNAFIYFVQPVAVDLVVATAFLVSACTTKPIVGRLAPDFYPVDEELAAHPRVRGLFRRLTLLWGLVILVKGTLTLWLLMSLSTVDFVLIKGGAVLALTLVATAATVVWSVAVARRHGLLLTGAPVGVEG